MRDSLVQNDILEFSQDEIYIIDKLLSSGSSVLAYLGHHKTKQTPVIIKEYYPLDDELLFEREETTILANDEELFKAKKEEFKQRISKFALAINQSFKDLQIYNNLSKTEVIYEDYNNTIYILQDYSYGKIYSEYHESNLSELIENIIALTKIAYELHKLGYIIFDIKPANLFMIDAIGQRIFNLIDYDSIHCIDEEIYTIKSTADYMPDDKIIDFKFDIYSIAKILEERLLDFNLDDYLSIVSQKFKMILSNCLCEHDNRYTDETLIRELEAVLKYSDIKALLVSNPKSTNCIGREDVFKHIEEELSKNHLVYLTGIKAIGKSTIAKAYASNVMKNYDRIQIIDFDHSWQKAFNNFSFENNFKLNKEIDIKDKIKMALTIHKPCLLVIINYEVNLYNDKVVEDLLSFGTDLLITTENNVDKSIVVGPLDEEAAIEVFKTSYYLNVDKSSLKYLKEIVKKCGYIPALIKLHAEVIKNINFENHHLFKINIFREYLKMLNNHQLLDFDLAKHSRFILGLDDLNIEDKQLLIILYYLNACGLKEVDCSDFHIFRATVNKLKSRQIIYTKDGYIYLNKLLEDMIYDVLFENIYHLDKSLINTLIDINNPNYLVSTLAHIDASEEELIKQLYSPDLFKECDDYLIIKYAKHFKEFKLVDQFDLDLYLNEIFSTNSVNLNLINDKLISEDDIIQKLNYTEAYKLSKHANGDMYNGRFNKALYNFIKSNKILAKYTFDKNLEIENDLNIFKLAVILFDYDLAFYYLAKAKTKLNPSHPRSLWIKYYYERASFLSNLAGKYNSDKNILFAFDVAKDFFDYLILDDYKSKDVFSKLSMILANLISNTCLNFAIAKNYDDYIPNNQLFESMLRLVNVVEKIYVEYHDDDYLVYDGNLYFDLYWAINHPFIAYPIIDNYLDNFKDYSRFIAVTKSNTILATLTVLSLNKDVLILDQDKLISNVQTIFDYSSSRSFKTKAIDILINLARYFKAYRNDQVLETIQYMFDKLNLRPNHNLARLDDSVNRQIAKNSPIDCFKFTSLNYDKLLQDIENNEFEEFAFSKDKRDNHLENQLVEGFNYLSSKLCSLYL